MCLYYNYYVGISAFSYRGVRLLCVIAIFMSFLYLSSLSTGRRATMVKVSSSIPGNVSMCVGHIVLSGLRGFRAIERCK